MKTVLILSPHTDDFELSCGGTVHKLRSRGYEIHTVTYSIASESLPSHLPTDTLFHEQTAAASSLGIDPEKITILDFPVRRFSERRQDILEQLVELRKEIAPSIVFCPSSYDIHQDHEVIHKECLRAFKNNSIYGMDLPWNYFRDELRCFSGLDEKDMKAKVEALRCYRSQQGRPYFDEELVWQQAKLKGSQFGLEYAEKFEVLRIVNNEF